MDLRDQPTYMDFFAGCGGLSLGLEQAGFFPLYVNELNSDAMETYLRNRDLHFPHLRERFNSSDIKKTVSDKGYYPRLLKEFSEVFGRDFKKNPVDVLAGGPPCQGFSGIGIRRSYSVDKVQLPSNHLYQDMAFAIHKVKPKIFLFENVEGLLRARWTKGGQKGEIFSDVFDTFNTIPNYEIRFKLVHAKDYGVPQNRPRVLIVGLHKSLKHNKSDALDAVEAGFLPSTTNDYPNIEDIFGDLIDKKFEYGGITHSYPQEARTPWQKSMRENPQTGKISKKGDVVTEHQYSKHNETVVERFTHMINNNGKIPDHLKTKKFAQRVLPRRWGNKGPNLTACSLPDDFVHYSQPRSLTVREWARLQTFPDWYQFAGKRTTGGVRRAGNPQQSIFEREVPKYTQIGNAVPVKLGYELARHFATLLR